MSAPAAPTSDAVPVTRLTRKDFTSNQEVRWCPGCDDYAILAQLQRTLPSLTTAKENHVFVSGIGCSSRTPYYMNTYGIHSIHGRAPAVATGVKLMRPELDVWVVTGDGDGMAIGGNHLMHALRRNIGLRILLFNNEIYGLTKGQASPTSEIGKVTKSSPDGTVDYPANLVSLALGAGATFVARVLSTDGPMLQEALKRAAAHRGTALLEIYQNCVIFNDGVFDHLTSAATKEEHQLRLVHGEPLRFGKDRGKGLVLDVRGQPTVVDVASTPADKLLVHDETSDSMAYILSRLGGPGLPTPLGVFRAVDRPSFEEMATAQIATARAKRKMTVQQLLEAGETWTV